MAQPGSEAQITSRISESVARLYLDTFGKGPLHVQTFVTVRGFDPESGLASEVFVLESREAGKALSS